MKGYANNLSRLVSRIFLCNSLALMIGAVSSVGHSAETNNPIEIDRPPGPYTPAYKKNYRFLSNNNKKNSLFDPIRYVPLTKTSWAQFGGLAREIYGYVDHPTLGKAGVSSDAFLLQRIQLHGDFHLFNDMMRFFVQVRDTRAFGKKEKITSPLDQSDTEVRQAFVDFKILSGLPADSYLRIGRQRMAYGDFTLTGPRSGPNVGRKYDGIRLNYKTKSSYELNIFGVRPVQKIRRGAFNDKSESHNIFYGIHGTVPYTKNVSGAFLAYGRVDKNPPLSNSADKESRYTIGTRFFNTDTTGINLNLNWKGLYQFGKLGEKKINAWALISSTSYQFNSLAGDPSIGMHFDVASGDSNPNDDESNTFDTLFPANGKLYLYSRSNETTLSNLIALGPQFTLKPFSSLTIHAQALQLWRESNSDSVYIASRQPIAGTKSVSGSSIGRRYDIIANWRATKNFFFQFAYDHVETGTVLNKVNAEDNNSLEIDAWFMF